MDTIMDSIGRAFWREFLLITWRIRTKSSVRAHDYPHIRRELRLDTLPQYKCVSIHFIDQPIFYLYTAGHPQQDCACAVYMGPRGVTDWEDEDAPELTDHVVFPNEYVIFGDCWCQQCEPFMGLLGPKN
jgi:hypothetical protein